MKMNLTIGLFIATLAVHAQTLAFEVT